MRTIGGCKKMKKQALATLLTAVLLFCSLVSPSAAFAQSAPSYDLSTKSIYANGTALTLTESSKNAGSVLTKVTYNNSANGLSISELSADADGGYDLSAWSIYGGAKSDGFVGDTAITMNSGMVKAVYGGGEGKNASVSGNATLRILGGTVTYTVCGYGAASNVSGTRALNIGGGVVIGSAQHNGVDLDSFSSKAISVEKSLNASASVSMYATVQTAGTVVATVSSGDVSSLSRLFMYKNATSAQMIALSQDGTSIKLSNAPVIITNTLSDGVTDSPYAYTLKAEGSTPITWSLQSGALPSGLRVSSDGVINGTPISAGLYTFTIKAENAGGANSRQLSLYISQKSIGGGIHEGVGGGYNGNQYRVIEGPLATSEGLRVTSEGPCASFVSVSIDSVPLSSSLYSVRCGSTVIVIPYSTLSSLKNGTHTLRIQFKDGRTDTAFVTPLSTSITSNPVAGAPSTGDSSALGILALLLAAGLLIVKKRVLS